MLKIIVTCLVMAGTNLLASYSNGADLDADQPPRPMPTRKTIKQSGGKKIQELLTDIDQEQDKLKKRAAEIDLALGPDRLNAAKLRADFVAAQKAFYMSKCGHEEGCTKSLFNVEYSLGGTGDREDAKTLGRTKTALEKQQPAIQALETENEGIKKRLVELAETRQIADKESNEPENAIPIFKSELENLRTDIAIKDLKNGTNDDIATLDNLALRMANSDMAAYFRDKMGQFVNSDLFCTATNRRCKTSQSEKIEILPEEIEKLFPELKGSQQRTNYYKKMHSGEDPTGNTTSKPKPQKNVQ